MPNPLTQIPAKVRYWLYLAYGLVTLALGGLQAAGVHDVHGLSVVGALAFLGFVGTVLGFTAASNVTETNTAAVQAPADVAIVPTDNREAGYGAIDLLLIVFIALVIVWLLVELFKHL